MLKTKYNYELLQSLCNAEILNHDYSNQTITRDTYIEGNCVTENCQNTFRRTFRYLYKRKNLCCHECCKNNAKIKAKHTFVINYGVENPMLSQKIKDKLTNALVTKYNVTHQMYLQETKDKIETTCLAKYGEKHPFKSIVVKEKIKNTCLSKYGVENVFQSGEFKEKSKITSLEKYNVEYPAQSKEFKEKSRNTNLSNYGLEYPSQRIDIKDKIKNTNLLRYGVEYPLQNQEIMNKSCKNAYKLKEYILPSGKIIKCQGYEPFALKELTNIFMENDIIMGAKNVPKIWYIDSESKKHRHYVDIFIVSQNKCIEVKSSWTFKKKNDIIFIKQATAKQLGYLYEIWVFDNKGNKINCIE